MYQGRHVESGKLVAVKVLAASLAREAGFVERFNREIDAMRKLKNPHIVEVFENGIEGESYYYSMEYVAGDTLMSLMRREKRLPWRQALDITCQTCKALKAAHDAGIIHRDLKPSNLLVSPEGVVKLTDFGVAQVFDSTRLTSTGGIIGTAEYMSPEQAEGKRASKQSDLYSLGAVLYTMVTGRTPFSGNTAVEVIQKHRFGLFDRARMYVTELPARVDDTICRLLEKEPEKRFPDAFVLLRHLEQIVRLEDFSATGVTLSDNFVEDISVPTVMATGGVRGQSAAGPGPATMMKSLLRAELDEAARGGPLTALFNNTYVLVGLLALVLWGGYWWFRPRQPTPEELFDRGSALLKQEPGPEWLRARREFFEPLLAADPDAWQDRLAPLLQQVERYELTRSIGGVRGKKHSESRSEGDRLIHLALHYRQIGDLARAERTLAALHDLLADNEEQAKLYELTGQLLDEVREQLEKADDRRPLLQTALDRATSLVKKGTVAEARGIWQAIIELYGDDLSAAEIVRQARDEIEKTRTTDSDPQ